MSQKKESLRKIHFASDGYREFGLVDELNSDYEPTGRKLLKIKFDGTGMVEGVECPIQIHFSMLKVDGDLLLDDLLNLKRNEVKK